MSIKISRFWYGRKKLCYSDKCWQFFLLTLKEIRVKPSYRIKALVNLKVIWFSLKFGVFRVLYFF